MDWTTRMLLKWCDKFPAFNNSWEQQARLNWLNMFMKILNLLYPLSKTERGADPVEDRPGNGETWI